MKISYLVLIIILFLSCQSRPQGLSEINSVQSKRIVEPTFQAILDSAKVKGSILIYDLQKDQYYSNDFEWAEKGRLPASTYKIPNSIIALETGVIESDTTLFKWDGAKRSMSVWEQDLSFKEALQVSCVPCYQEVARKIGVDKMKNYLERLQYGKMSIDSSTLDLFWLVGDSKINQFEQIDFLSRLSQSKLPISKRTDTIIKNMLVLKQDEYHTLRGKTGWAIREGENNGWFVGYVQSEEKVYVFATNIDPMEGFDMSKFSEVRKAVSMKALKELHILK